MVTRRREATLGQIIAAGLFLWVRLCDVAGIRIWAAQTGSRLIVGALGGEGLMVNAKVHFNGVTYELPRPYDS